MFAHVYYQYYIANTKKLFPANFLAHPVCICLRFHITEIVTTQGPIHSVCATFIIKYLCYYQEASDE